MSDRFDRLPRIKAIGLAHRFAERCKNSPDKPFAFLLGAGSSVSARRECHIKSAKDMVGDWILRLYRDAGESGDVQAALKWGTARTLGIETYDPTDPAGSYAEVYAKAFAIDQESGRHYIQNEVDARSPDLGYYILAQIISQGPTRLILTTNFDNHALDALSSVSTQYPLVVGHEVLAGYVQDRPTRPTVIKLHRDLFYGIKNSSDETSRMDAELAELVLKLCRSHPLIVVGYAGNDGSLMDVLLSLEPNAFPSGLYWCWYEQGVEPSEKVIRLVEKQHGVVVPIGGFNELMYLFSKELELESPDRPVDDRSQARRELIGEGLIALQETGSRNDSRSTDASIEDRDLAVAKESLVKSANEGATGEKGWWQWQLEINAVPVAERERAYEIAIEALPGSAELVGNFAIFLKNNSEEFDRTESLFEAALELNPSSPMVTHEFARFLSSVRDDKDRAAKMLKRASHLRQGGAAQLLLGGPAQIGH